MLRNGQCEASPLGSTDGKDPSLERLEHLMAMSKALSGHFRGQMEKLVAAVNAAPNPQSLGLDARQFGLPFNDSLLATGGARAALEVGPIKRADRAAKKANEYGALLRAVVEAWRGCRGENEVCPVRSSHSIHNHSRQNK